MNITSLEKEYARAITALKQTGISALLPHSGNSGVIGIDGNEYPVPTQEQAVKLFAHNRELVGRKVRQGFNRLEVVPFAMPIPLLIDRMNAAILKHAAGGKIYQTRRTPSDPLVSVRVNKESWSIHENILCGACANRTRASKCWSGTFGYAPYKQ